MNANIWILESGTFILEIKEIFWKCVYLNKENPVQWVFQIYLIGGEKAQTFLVSPLQNRGDMASMILQRNSL